ncbi:uncharacterized protein J8A68_002595 [[Candida] subhashii]|uniref:Uncharacterized protein n=1 Tax=[Candida] subhashii TaxID=561895 RepID=A0A8J5QRB4_9ASCO|nr:uncharacterized protein J8A68_002595 [[Candida] subhashii]KAG7663847.1 hypothetical protein J8A68_002595 [[Candida] subhashii]
MSWVHILVLVTSCVFLGWPWSTFIEPPSKDDFYIPPEGFEYSNLGDILNVRMVINQIGNVFPAGVKNIWQVLVRSQDSFENPNAIVTTIVEPYNADPTKIVSYQTFEDAANINCSPSYTLRYGTTPTIATFVEMQMISMILESGYYLVIPDYEGPKSAFAVGGQSSNAILDSIRAVVW